MPKHDNAPKRVGESSKTDEQLHMETLDAIDKSVSRIVASADRLSKKLRNKHAMLNDKQKAAISATVASACQKVNDSINAPPTEKKARGVGFKMPRE